MKRYLHLKGIDLSTPKDVFRQAARANLINDPEPWFDFQKKRNLAAHTYDDVELHAVVASLDKFSLELTKLIDTIESTEI
jgi:nucleotidyltransferase substrate binding protein (TIGR01987 family)